MNTELILHKLETAYQRACVGPNEPDTAEASLATLVDIAKEVCQYQMIDRFNNARFVLNGELPRGAIIFRNTRYPDDPKLNSSVRF